MRTAAAHAFHPRNPRASLTLRPLLLALRGIAVYLEPQLTWQRFPLGVLMLLALPVLVYLTTPSTTLGGARIAGTLRTVGAFASRLARSNCPTAEQSSSC